jgi:hypothetical protein
MSDIDLSTTAAKSLRACIVRSTIGRLKSGGASMTVERAVRMIAGLFVLLSPMTCVIWGFFTK